MSETAPETRPVPTPPAPAPFPADPAYAGQPMPYTIAPPKPKRPFPWRWAGAVVVMLAVGAGSAYGVMAPKRTDLPGLATAADGRYIFAPLTLPSLAPGQADPTASANAGGQHLSDIRKLLLPAPAGATADHALPGASGWVSQSATLKEIGSGTASDLAKDGWRHTAGTAWKTPDGADTKIYLLQFIDDAAARDAQNGISAFNTGDTEPLSAPDSVGVQYSTVKHGATTTWYGATTIGDTEFLIVYTAPSSVGITPFKQEVDLQVEMLL